MINEEPILLSQDKIVEASAKLFYENGYNNTSFRNIAEACDITKGLITYHFESKAKLAKKVIFDYNIGIKNMIEEKIIILQTNYDALTNMIIEALALNEMYYTDTRARRFFLEYLDSGFANQYIDAFAGFYKMINRQYQFDRSATEFKMLSTSQMFTALSLLYSYFTGGLDCSYDEYVAYSLKLQLRILGLSEKKSDDIFTQATHLKHRINYQIKPYFKIE